MLFDLVIQNGLVVDGTGNPWYKADIGISGDRIAAIGRFTSNQARTVIDASGMVVCPGFIDMHSHSDLIVFAEPELPAKVMQGITTEVITQDGMSAAPVTDKTASVWRKILAGLDGDPPIDWTWRTLADYLNALESVRPAVNIVALVPYGNVRSMVLGFGSARPNTAEIEAMKNIVARSMDEGAFGMSLGLIYQPQMYATKEELVELYRVVAEHDGFMVVHMRNEGDRILEAVDEVIDICVSAGCPLHVSHLKVAGKENWNKGPDLLKRFEAARRRGLDVTFDQYPYTAGSTYLHACLPPWATEGGVDQIVARLKNPNIRMRIAHEIETMVGSRRPTDDPTLMFWDNFVGYAGWDGIRITSVRHERNKYCEGRTIAELADVRGMHPSEFMFDLLIDEECGVSMAAEISGEDNVRLFLAHELGMIGTDGLLVGKPHPRAYGTFPRVLGKYVREQNVLSLPQMIRRMTSLPAQRLGLHDRGVLRPGMKADVVVFDAEIIADRATFLEPRQFSVGIDAVIVNGAVTVEKGRLTGLRAGRVLRKQRGTRP